MQPNETLLELWIESLRAELSELSGTSIRVSSAPYEGNHRSAYQTNLLAEGPVHGELHITVEAASLVQFIQLSLGEPLDPDAICTPEQIEVWRRLLDGTASRLSARLSADFTDSQKSKCVVLLADTQLLEERDLLSGEPGSRIQRWLLQAGQSQIAVLARAKIEFPEIVLPLAQATSATGDHSESAQALEAKVSSRMRNQEEDQTRSATSTAVNDGSMPRVPSGAAPSEQKEMESKSVGSGRSSRAIRDLDASRDSAEPGRRLDLLLDIELEATLRFGAIEMPLREVLELGPGDVLSLDRHVQEPVELVVGDRIVARGEVVLIGGNFGLHVTEVAEPRRRLETIRCLF